MQIQQFNEHF